MSDRVIHEKWGATFRWACGHSAVTYGDHDLWHEHWCPICHPGRRDRGCNVQYQNAR